MIKVTDVVLDLIKTDELALESLRAGLLNLSAYADRIQARVENATFKEVKRGTIVVALSRIAKNLPKVSPLTPDVKISNLSVRSSLAIYTYEKSQDIQRKISVLNPFLLPINDLFSVVEGPSEVSLIVAEKSKGIIEKHFNMKPKSEAGDLAAITCEFDKKSVMTPNSIYVLLGSLAAKRINIIEIVSTFTEISFVVKKEDMEETLKALNVYFGKIT